MYCSTGTVSAGADQELSVQAQNRSCQYMRSTGAVSTEAIIPALQYRSCEYRRNTGAVSAGAIQELSVQELSFLHCSTGAVQDVPVQLPARRLLLTL